MTSFKIVYLYYILNKIHKTNYKYNYGLIYGSITYTKFQHYVRVIVSSCVPLDGCFFRVWFKPKVSGHTP